MTASEVTDDPRSSVQRSVVTWETIAEYQDILYERAAGEGIARISHQPPGGAQRLPPADRRSS